MSKQISWAIPKVGDFFTVSDGEKVPARGTFSERLKIIPRFAKPSFPKFVSETVLPDILWAYLWND